MRGLLLRLLVEFGRRNIYCCHSSPRFDIQIRSTNKIGARMLLPSNNKTRRGRAIKRTTNDVASSIC